MIFYYLTFGQYDFAALMELPDDESAARIAINLNRLGNVTTQTVRAFTEDEAIALSQSLDG